jgi:rhodanese-related sulfurtransferase
MKNLNIVTIVILSFVLTNCAQNKAKETVEITIETKAVIQKEVIVEHISTLDFKSKVESKQVQLVDVRTPDEYNEAHLENATLIDYKNAEFLQNVNAKLDKSKPVYVYCHSGGRSARASKILEEAGFTKVYDMKGGISGWKTANLKTVK